MQIKNNLVIVDKGFKWANFKAKAFHKLVTQIITLSRYTHSSIVFKKRGVWFELEADFKGLWLKRADTKEILSRLENNKADGFYKKPIKNDYRTYVLESASCMIDLKIPEIRLAKYSFKGLLNQLPLNLVGKSLITRTDSEKMFCSESVHYFLTADKKSFLKSPCDIAINDDSYKRVV